MLENPRAGAVFEQAFSGATCALLAGDPALQLTRGAAVIASSGIRRHQLQPAQTHKSSVTPHLPEC